MPWWCDYYGAFLFVGGALLIVAAGIAALVEIAHALRTKRAAAEVSITESTIAETTKALEALKGVLEAIKGLPAWIPIFLAGLALVWLAGQRPEACVPVLPATAPAPPAQ